MSKKDGMIAHIDHGKTSLTQAVFLAERLVRPMPGPSECDWPKGFEHENGNYACNCHRCKNVFYGHKRRVTCKVCAKLSD